MRLPCNCAVEVLHKKLHPCRLYNIPFLCSVKFILYYFKENEQSKGVFMKKLIVSAMAALLILGTLSAEEGGGEAKSKVKYSTNINVAIAWPLEAKLSVAEIIKVPFLNFNTPFTRGNNVAFKLRADMSPVTLEGKFDIVWTPIAFLELYGGASIGSGWSIITKSRLGSIHGLSFNTANAAGKTTITPINFRRAFYSANLGGAVQFDLGAIIPADWTHVIARIDQYFLYRGVIGADSSDSWVFQNDAGTNRNGWTYFGSYVLGYQMPLPLQLIALQIETKKTLFRGVRAGLDKSDWGENRFSVVFGPILNFKVTDMFTITLIAQLKTVHTYNSSDDTLFYQYRTINKSIADKVKFKRVAVIFDVTLPNN